MKNLLKDLIEARSATDTGELAACKVLADYFADQEISAKVDCWDDNRANCTAHITSTGEKPALMFVSHIDVVPPGDQQWDFPPFEAKEVDGKILGRGSTDMKGGLSAAAAAVAESVSEFGDQLKGDIIFTATAGEETDSCGIQKFVENYVPALPALAGIIIPEPTNFDIVTAHRGILWLNITTRGKTAHGSMPHEGINAVLHMNTLLNALKDLEINFPPHPKMGACTMSVNKITGGNAINVIPDKCTINIDIRTLPGQTHEQIIEQFAKIIAKLSEADSEFKADIEIERSVEAMESDNNSQFIRDFCKVTGIGETKEVGYTTDAPHLAHLNAPTTIFGPGNTAVCHKPNESVELTELEKGKEYYKKIIKHYLT